MLNSGRTLEQRTAYVSGESFILLSPGDRLRISRRNTTGTSNTKISFWDIVVKV